MKEHRSVLEQFDEVGRAHPGWISLLNAILMMFITIVLLMTTEAPIVLYQAF